jgi:hypothetical protein
MNSAEPESGSPPQPTNGLAAPAVPAFTVPMMRRHFDANSFDKSAEFFPPEEVVTHVAA